MREWQTIDSAPIDGDEYLVWCPSEIPDLGFRYVAWNMGDGWIWSSNDTETKYCEPTLWMLLPASPKHEKGGEADIGKPITEIVQSVRGGE